MYSRIPAIFLKGLSSHFQSVNENETKDSHNSLQKWNFILTDFGITSKR